MSNDSRELEPNLKTFPNPNRRHTIPYKLAVVAWHKKTMEKLQLLKQQIEAEKKHHQDNKFRNGQLNILTRIGA